MKNFYTDSMRSERCANFPYKKEEVFNLLVIFAGRTTDN